MPKRPCALDFTPDRVTILVADKFGDVYALPLIPSGAPETPTPSARDCTPATPVPFRPQANELTVHSKRNLRALLDQRKAVLQPSEKPAAASFEHTLLLGHVSMLTGITHATDPHTGRPYIITADRDEHLRVSRGVLSQAHVIEGFCFGHDEFISRICIPPASPELLLSAGGDDEIYLWEWCAGRLITKANVLSHVQEIRPEANRVAVSFLCAHGSGSGGSEPSHHVFVFCER